MNEYAWHYFNLSMDNTNRCHIYLFSSAHIQGSTSVQVGSLRQWATTSSTSSSSSSWEDYHWSLYKHIVSLPWCVQKCFAVTPVCYRFLFVHQSWRRNAETKAELELRGITAGCVNQPFGLMKLVPCSLVDRTACQGFPHELQSSSS